MPPRRKSTPPNRRSPPPRLRSTACARRRGWASAPRSMCSTRSRTSSTRGWRSSPRNVTGWWRPTRYWRRPARCRRKSSGSGSKSTIRSRTTSRCATPGAACARPTGGKVPILTVLRCPGGSAPFRASALHAGPHPGDTSLFAFASRHAIVFLFLRTALILNRELGLDLGSFRGGTRPMTQPAKGQEPSMEEILASIRRIIADEEPAKDATEDTTERRLESVPAAREGAVAPRETAPRPVTPPPRIAPAAAAASASPKTDEEIDAMLAHLRGPSRQPAAAIQESGPTEAPAAPEPAPALDERGLLSAATTAAVDAAFDTLARTAQARGGRTLEEVVSELLRPMLKSWLDENLPEMVERLVRAEIERVSRGRS